MATQKQPLPSHEDPRQEPRDDYRKDRIPETADKSATQKDNRSGDDWDDRPYASPREEQRPTGSKPARRQDA